MFSAIFIKRPILATVISLVLAGAVSAKFLPVAEYPLVSPADRPPAQATTGR